MSQLIIYTVYNKPSDFPDHVVCRRWLCDADGTEKVDKELFASYPTKEEMYNFLMSKGLVQMGRHQDDDPVILGNFI